MANAIKSEVNTHTQTNITYNTIMQEWESEKLQAATSSSHSPDKKFEIASGGNHQNTIKL